MKKFSFLFVVIILFGCNSKNTEQSDKNAILAVLNSQAKAWSNYNIEEFMEGYWQSDSLKFYGANGITYGWQSTLDNYKKRYPTKDSTGELTFKINAISKINSEAYYVMGEYYLTRPIGDTNGIFMVIFKKIDGHWKIIADTSC